MITFFTHCRPFEGEFDKLQRQAIASWVAAVPDCQIVMLGHGGHFAFPYSFARAEANDHGMALVSDVFATGEEMASHDLLCEISSDIVLGADVNRALRAIEDVERPFVIGQRWDIDPGADPDTATLHPASAADYFIFRRGTLGPIPPFAVGRTAYDNWLIWAAIEQWGCTVIDATEVVTAIHVRHSYPEYGDKARMLQSEERKENHRLGWATGMPRWYRVTDAPYVLTPAGEVKERGHA